MSAVIIPGALSITRTNADFELDLIFCQGAEDRVEDWTGSQVRVSLWRKAGAQTWRLTLDSATGEGLVPPTAYVPVGLRVPAATMHTLPAGNYNGEVLRIFPNGAVELAATFAIKHEQGLTDAEGEPGGLSGDGGDVDGGGETVKVLKQIGSVRLVRAGGAQGLSAKQVVLDTVPEDLDPNATDPEFAAWIRKPATDAAAELAGEVTGGLAQIEEARDGALEAIGPDDSAGARGEALTAIGGARQGVLDDVAGARQGALDDVAGARQGALDDVASARSGALTAIGGDNSSGARGEAIAAVEATASTQQQALGQAGAAQVQAVADEAASLVASLETAGAAQGVSLAEIGDAKVAAILGAPSVSVRAFSSSAAGIAAGDTYFAVPMAYSKAARVYQNVGGVATYLQTVPWLGGYLYPAAITHRRAFGSPESLMGRHGLFWFDMIDGWDSDKQRVPNALFPAALSDNRLFLNSGYLGSLTNGTVTVKAALGPGGEQTAALLSYNNGATVSFFGPVVLPAGNWVFKYVVENNAAGTITFRHGKSNATVSYTTDSVSDAAWVTITENFTADGVSAYSYGIGNNTGAAQAVKVDRLQLYAAADGAPLAWADEPMDLSLRRNLRLPNSLPISPEVLEATATGHVFHIKLPSYPAHTEIPGMTVCMAGISTGYTANRAMLLAPGDASQLVHTSNGYDRFRFGPRYTTGQTRSYLELVAPGFTYEAYVNLEAFDDTYQVVIATFGEDGNGVDLGPTIFADGFEVGPSEAGGTLSAPLTEAFFKLFGSQSASAVPPIAETIAPNELAMIGMEKQRIGRSKALLMTDRMRAAARAKGLKVLDEPTVTLTESDSILAGNPRETNTTPSHAMRTAVSPTAWVVTMGRAGSVLGYPGDTDSLSLYGRQPRLLRNLTRAYSDGRIPRLVGQIGANDFARIMSNPSTYVADILAYLTVVRDHWTSIGGTTGDLKILWGDILPRGAAGSFSSGTATAFNAARAVANADLATAVGGGVIDILIPMGSHPIMGPDAAANDPLLFDASDKLHPTRPLGAGHILDSIVSVWEPTLV